MKLRDRTRRLIRNAASTNTPAELTALYLLSGFEPPDIAEYLGVAERQVFDWWNGRRAIPAKHRQALRALVDSASRAASEGLREALAKDPAVMVEGGFSSCLARLADGAAAAARCLGRT